MQTLRVAFFDVRAEGGGGELALRGFRLPVLFKLLLNHPHDLSVHGSTLTGGGIPERLPHVQGEACLECVFATGVLWFSSHDIMMVSFIPKKTNRKILDITITSL